MKLRSFSVNISQILIPGIYEMDETNY